jgi:hypothetical protein
MRRPFFVRLTLATLGTLALWLASTSVAQAATARRHRQQHHSRPQARVCEADRPAPRAVTYSKPVRKMVRRNVFPLLQRTLARPLLDDDAAIQNGAAAGEHDNREFVAGLKAIGLLASSHSALLSHSTVSRRSPRGPPPAST